MTGRRPLEGLRVLDLSRVLAGPMGGRILSDLGAEVVKVEPPEGDITRIWGKRVAGLSGYYTQQNAGKRCISIDLSTAKGRELVLDLATVADVVVENFRPGVMRRFGLDWEQLSARNPRLVMLSISGFGQDGPEADRAAYAAVLHAESGIVARQAALDGVGMLDQIVSFADVLACMHGLVGVMAALAARAETGRGDHVDLAMLDAMCFSDDAANYVLEGAHAPRVGGEVWDTATGHVMISGDLKWVWHQLSGAHHLVDGCAPDATVAEKVAARRAAITEYLRSLPGAAEVHAALDAAGLAWGDVKTGREVYESPTLHHRASLVDIPDRAGGTRPVVQSPYRFAGSASGVQGAAPFRGEHNAEVLSDWLGMAPAVIDDLVAEGVLLTEDIPGRAATAEGKELRCTR